MLYQKMDIDFYLRDFANQARLFPLPNLVVFPHALLPLHIFEPRYRQLTEDALATDRLVTMVQVAPAPKGSSWPEPVPIVEVGCLGRIVQHERLPDGRFNFLLLGCKRVRLVREHSSEKLYRIAEAEILEDRHSDQPTEPRRQQLLDLFRAIFEKRHRLDEDLAKRLISANSLGVLSDIIAHAIGLPPGIKQELLAETMVDRRVETLLMILRTIMDAIIPDEPSSRSFPPPFSLN
jgi:Lon protease-like protein